MENVILIVHLVLALSLIGVVLLQRSEGGGLGMGGGGGVMTGRAAATALGKITWGLAIAFICTSIALTIIAAEQSAGVSVVDRLQDAPAPAGEPATLPTDGGSLLPPSAGDAGGGDVPLAPSAD
ncbi:preprotein translocase subunit SecG [Wenxinia saemankumensis]|uniref:Protein-export membrane protein SecG n=1 Tax=Wenxinia saemankumensis TaxID=1447782 RepID=A0A1M6CH85_9RHOB|nr:preprotein translocase subunit SecG [Wenxinia saemankumensis]SHI60114.1 protein translocase subunit secG [Wenxinia saemankumensis]